MKQDDTVDEVTRLRGEVERLRGRLAQINNRAKALPGDDLKELQRQMMHIGALSRVD